MTWSMSARSSTLVKGPLSNPAYSRARERGMVFRTDGFSRQFNPFPPNTTGSLALRLMHEDSTHDPRCIRAGLAPFFTAGSWEIWLVYSHAHGPRAVINGYRGDSRRGRQTGSAGLEFNDRRADRRGWVGWEVARGGEVGWKEGMSTGPTRDVHRWWLVTPDRLTGLVEI